MLLHRRFAGLADLTGGRRAPPDASQTDTEAECNAAHRTARVRHWPLGWPDTTGSDHGGTLSNPLNTDRKNGTVG